MEATNKTILKIIKNVEKFKNKILIDSNGTPYGINGYEIFTSTATSFVWGTRISEEIKIFVLYDINDEQKIKHMYFSSMKAGLRYLSGRFSLDKLTDDEERWQHIKSFMKGLGFQPTKIEKDENI